MVPGRSSANPALVLKSGKERALERRHPWVYAAAVARVIGAPGAGDLVAVRSSVGRFLAWAAYSPHSSIRARCWSFDESDCIDARWLTARVATAVARRVDLRPRSNALRLVCGEADGLPGLIADQYGEVLVVQIQSAGIERQREVLLEALHEHSSCRAIFERSDPALRQREGLEAGGGTLRGPAPPERVLIEEDGVRYAVDVRRGHKTGFYLDQRDNRQRVAALVRSAAQRLGRAPRILNCFCYTGGFGLAAACAGAGLVVSIDTSADALALARHNAELNGLAPGSAASTDFDWQCADVFTQLRALYEQGARFDCIVLDPPKFATNQHQVERAARAYKDINLSGLRLLEAGGSLLSFSCSAAVGVDLFQKIVASAIADSGIDCYLRARLSAGADHPTLMSHPEGEYLKGLLLQRI